MPVVDGRWVSPSKYKALEDERIKAAREAAAQEDPTSVADERTVAPKPKRSRRSTKAAEAALAKATGLDITLED